MAASAFTGPAVAAILTGNYPRFSGFGFNDRAVLVEDQRTLAESFSSVGYRTAAFVSNPYVSKEFGFGQGFEVYEQEMPQLELVRGLPERMAGDTTDAALERLGELGRHERVFLYVHYMDPHGPYTPPAEFLQRFTPERPGRRIPAEPEKGANSGRGFVPHYQDVVDSRGYDEYGESSSTFAEFRFTDQETLVKIDANVLHGALLSVGAYSGAEPARNQRLRESGCRARLSYQVKG